MCGIIGYVGNSKASPFIVEALKRMEYRGYDSAGIATFDDNFIIKKGVGKVEELDEKLNFAEMNGTVGIGHTRWATHGNVTDENAHPHWSCKGDVVIVHNGIIENFLGLKEFLISRGHKFKSQTDSEVIAHLIEESIQNYGDLQSAITNAATSLKGSYAFLVMLKSEPNLIIAVRKDAPLIVGLGSGENYLSSDVLGFISRTNQATFLDNKEIAFVTDSSADFFDFTGKRISKAPTTVAWKVSDVSKKEYLHYTLKEIHEQPRAIGQTLSLDEHSLGRFVRAIKGTRDLFITGCGTSYHAGLLMKYILAKTARIKADVLLSS